MGEVIAGSMHALDTEPLEEKDAIRLGDARIYG